jgi:hypothetical protein
MTFGEFIARTFKAFGRHQARAIVLHAVNAHLLQFRGQQRFLVS